MQDEKNNAKGKNICEHARISELPQVERFVRGLFVLRGFIIFKGSLSEFVNLWGLIAVGTHTLKYSVYSALAETEIAEFDPMVLS